MKNTTIFLATCLICLLSMNAKAQLAKGQIQLGGYAQFSTSQSNTSGNENKSMNFGIVPRVGFMVTDRLAVGLQGIVQSTESDYTYNYDFSSTNQKWKTQGYGGGLFATNYIPLSDKIYFHLNHNLLYIREVQTSEYTYTPIVPTTPAVNTTQKSNRFSIFTQPGLTVSLTNRWVVQANIGYLGFDQEMVDNDDSNSDFNFSWNALQFGTFVNF